MCAPEDRILKLLVTTRTWSLTVILWTTSLLGCLVTRDESLWKNREGGAGPGGAGLTWTVVQSPVREHLNAVWGQDRHAVWVVGDKGTILHYNGSAWTRQGAGVADTNLKAIWGSSRSDIWALGDDFTVLRFDGSTWKRVFETDADKDLAAIWGSAANDLWFAGKDKSDQTEDVLFHCNGNTWQAVPLPEAPGIKELDIKALWGSSAREVFAVGHGGAIAEYRDGTWHLVNPSPVKDNLKAVRGTADGRVRAIGDKGARIVRGTNGAWAKDASADASVFFKALWAQSGKMLAVGGTKIWQGEVEVKESIIAYHDGSDWGALWSWPYPDELRGVWGAPSGPFWVVGQEGTLLRGAP